MQEIKSFDKENRLVDVNIPAKKGIYVYHALEGGCQGGDYPVGYHHDVNVGDYFRYLIPTKPVLVDDLPFFINKHIVKSDIIDFKVDRLIETNDVLIKFSRFMEPV